MDIHLATLNDVSDLAAFAAASFINTFGHMYTPDNLALFLQKTRSETGYAEAITSPHHKIWLIRDKHDETHPIIAYCKAGKNSLPSQPLYPKALEISQLYVAQTFHGHGYGQALLLHSIQYAREQKFPEMILGVYFENTGAQRLYQKHGFRKIDEYDFPVGTHIDREFIYLKPL